MRLPSRTMSVLSLVTAILSPQAAGAADPNTARLTAANPTSTRTGSGNDLNISPNPNLNTPGQTNVIPLELPTSAPLASGLFPSAGRTLLDHGVDIHGIILDRFLANPSAGSQTGYGYNLGTIRPFVDIDLNKLVGLPGGNVHFAASFFIFKANTPNFHFQVGGELAAATAGKVAESNTLTLLTYEQKLMNDKLSIEVGRTNVHQYFFIPNSIDPFSYDSGLTYADADINSNTYSQWGGRVNYHFTPAWYVQAGAFQDDYRRATLRNFAIGTSLTSGVNVLGELAYRTEFTTEAYPANLEAGFEWNTRHGYSNVKGSAANAVPGRTAANYSGGGLLFFQGSKVLWRDSAQPGSLPKNIAVYGQLDGSVDKPQPIDFDAMIGVNFTGFIPGRPNDVLEAQVKYQRLSAIETAFETKMQALRGGSRTGTQSRNGVGFELADRVVATPWLAITGLAQYFITPDAYFSPTQRRPKDGVLVGAFATVSFGPLLGTSRKPF